MERFHRHVLRQLLGEADDETAISAYLPMLHAGRDARQNGIRLKNMLRRVEGALATRCADRRKAAVTVERIAAATGDDLRQVPGDGLALFVSGDKCLSLACPESFVPRLTLARRFDVVPLLALDREPARGYVLALSRKCVRLVDVAHTDAGDAPLDAAVPRSLIDAVGADIEQPASQHHSAGGRRSIHHGQGTGEDDVLAELETYCRRIAAGLAHQLHGAAVPLLLAGDAHLAAIFRRTAGHLTLVDEQIYGNHDRTSATQLREFARPALEARSNDPEHRWAATFLARSGTGGASDDAAEIWRAARDGRVDTLLVNRDRALDGAGDRGGDLAEDPRDEGPFNAEAILTLRHGGSAHLLAASQMPTEAPMAAIMRF